MDNINSKSIIITFQCALITAARGGGNGVLQTLGLKEP